VRVCLVTAATATEFENAADAKSSRVRSFAALPHLGILTLASVLERAGVSPAVINLNRLYYEYLESGTSGSIVGFAAWAAERILSSGADIYGLSSICSSYPLTIRICDALKRRRPDAAIVLGGPQASAVDLGTLAAFPSVDFILRGEADETFQILLEEWSGKRCFSAVPGLTWRSPFGPARTCDAPLIADLDSLPLPAYHLDGALPDLAAVPLELGRGCPFACTFCSTNDFFRRKFRVKSPESMLGGMRAVASQYGRRRFELVHDMFTVDRRRVVAFCRHVLESGEKFTWDCSARTDCVDDELLELMAAAGCVGIFFGIETGSVRMQRIIDKDLDPVRARAMVATAERLGIPTTVSLITGFPEENWDDLRETVGIFMYSLRHAHSEPQLNLLAPLAGTPVYSRHKDELILEELCSAESYQGRTQNEADRVLIRTHPHIFPNFYLVPAPGLDRKMCLELREFALVGGARMRWLLLALHQAAGILEIFLAWLVHREGLHPGLAGGALRNYYALGPFVEDFLAFVRGRLADLSSPAVAALLSFQEALARAGISGAALPRAGWMVVGPVQPCDRPVRRRHVEVIELDCDIRAMIDALQRGETAAPVMQRKLFHTTLVSAGAAGLSEITPLLAEALRICDGSRTAEEFMVHLAGCLDCPEHLQRFGAEYLLERIRSEDLIEIYRHAPKEQWSGVD
jgi:hypothetical protein